MDSPDDQAKKEEDRIYRAMNRATSTTSKGSQIKLTHIEPVKVSVDTGPPKSKWAEMQKEKELKRIEEEKKRSEYLASQNELLKQKKLSGIFTPQQIASNNAPDSGPRGRARTTPVNVNIPSKVAPTKEVPKSTPNEVKPTPKPETTNSNLPPKRNSEEVKFAPKEEKIMDKSKSSRELDEALDFQLPPMPPQDINKSRPKRTSYYIQNHSSDIDSALNELENLSSALTVKEDSLKTKEKVDLPPPKTEEKINLFPVEKHEKTVLPPPILKTEEKTVLPPPILKTEEKTDPIIIIETHEETIVEKPIEIKPEPSKVPESIIISEPPKVEKTQTKPNNSTNPEVLNALDELDALQSYLQPNEQTKNLPPKIEKVEQKSELEQSIDLIIYKKEYLRTIHSIPQSSDVPKEDFDVISLDVSKDTKSFVELIDQSPFIVSLFASNITNLLTNCWKVAVSLKNFKSRDLTKEINELNSSAEVFADSVVKFLRAREKSFHEYKSSRTEAFTELNNLIKTLQISFQLTIPLCNKCGKTVDGSYTIVNDNTAYHQLCFCCDICRIPLTSYFQTPEGDLLCENDYKNHLIHAGKAVNCDRCKQFIDGNYVKIDTKNYHKHCYTCFKCNGPIEGKFYEVPFNNNIEVYCQNCY